MLGLAAPSFGADTIFLAEAGTGATTVYANWNGTGYDDVHVVIWAYDPGDEDATAISAYQVAMHDAIPQAGASGDVKWVGETATIDAARADYLHRPNPAVMPPEVLMWAHGGTPPRPSMVASAKGRFHPSLHGLDDSPKYLSEITFEISPDATGTWIVRPYCTAEDGCRTGPNCVRSGGTCTVDSDCPRYAVLGDLTDTCDHDGIDLEDGLILIDENGVVLPYEVETLEIVISGRCCDGLTCLGSLSPGECEAAGGQFDEFHTCFDGCGCGDGLVSTDEGEECDDGNLISGDGCDASCITEFCGDGTTQPGLGEGCDDGNTIDDDGCDSNCTRTGCGNGIMTFGEQCDDGNRIDGDGCDRDCIFEVCGNGVWQQGYGEECDDGNTLDGDGCTGSCLYPVTACSTDLDCVFAHDNACDWDDCDEIEGTCKRTIGNMYGDVCGANFTAPANGAVNVTDILCTLSAFGAGNLANCPNADVATATADSCPRGNGIVNLTDVLKIVDAFGAPGSATASFFCDCPLNP